MSKYKVGDRVVVVSEKKAKDLTAKLEFLPDMKPLCGETVTIKKVDYDGTYKLEGFGYWWCDEFFEGLDKSTSEKENNTMNKKDILAVRNYNDRAMVMQFNKKDKNGKNIQTRAEVHDGDTFDLDEGIRICLLKYLLGGHKNYMAIMDAARKAYKKTVKEDSKKAAEKYKKAITPAANEKKKKEKRDKEIEELITKAIKKALAETAESNDKTVEE